MRNIEFAALPANADYRGYELKSMWIANNEVDVDEYRTIMDLTLGVGRADLMLSDYFYVCISCV